ncbi:hypothetical protein Tco_0505383 [Tanacetum coccineum]
MESTQKSKQPEVEYHNFSTKALKYLEGMEPQKLFHQTKNLLTFFQRGPTIVASSSAFSAIDIPVKMNVQKADDDDDVSALPLLLVMKASFGRSREYY